MDKAKPELVAKTHTVNKPRRWGPERRPIVSPTADRRNFDVSSVSGERLTALFEGRTKSFITYMGAEGEKETNRLVRANGKIKPKNTHVSYPDDYFGYQKSTWVQYEGKEWSLIEDKVQLTDGTQFADDDRPEKAVVFLQPAKKAEAPKKEDDDVKDEQHSPPHTPPGTAWQAVQDREQRQDDSPAEAAPAVTAENMPDTDMGGADTGGSPQADYDDQAAAYMSVLLTDSKRCVMTKGQHKAHKKNSEDLEFRDATLWSCFTGAKVFKAAILLIATSHLLLDTMLTCFSGSMVAVDPGLNGGNITQKWIHDVDQIINSHDPDMVLVQIPYNNDYSTDPGPWADFIEHVTEARVGQGKSVTIVDSSCTDRWDELEGRQLLPLELREGVGSKTGVVLADGHDASSTAGATGVTTRRRRRSWIAV